MARQSRRVDRDGGGDKSAAITSAFIIKEKWPIVTTGLSIASR
jgi:hypothetical protein